MSGGGLAGADRWSLHGPVSRAIERRPYGGLWLSVHDPSGSCAAVIAFVAEMAKAAGYATHAGFFGGIIFLFLAGPAEDPCSLRWRRRIAGALPWLAAGYAAALTAAGLTEASSAAGIPFPGILGQPDRLQDFALGTRVGLVATLRLAAALLMLLAAIVIVRFKKGSTAALAVTLLLAAMAPIPGAFASHAAGDDQAGYLMPAYIVHM